MVSGEYEVVIHEQVGDVEVIIYFKHYEHFKKFKGWESGDDGEESFREEKQTSPQEEIKPQDFGVYPSLVGLWGKEKAYKELKEVIKNYPDREVLLKSCQDKHLDNAFYWGVTPQGSEFWGKICSQLQAKSVY